MTRWFIFGDAVHQENENGIPDGAIIVPRPPERYEFWNGTEWELNSRQMADMEAGSTHIGEARALKYMEAISIKSGLTIPDGMLSAEATQKGMTLDALVEEVLAKRVEFIAAELLRQARQSGAMAETE